jgi:hypothetical protein
MLRAALVLVCLVIAIGSLVSFVVALAHGHAPVGPGFVLIADGLVLALLGRPEPEDRWSKR